MSKSTGSGKKKKSLWRRLQFWKVRARDGSADVERKLARARLVKAFSPKWVTRATRRASEAFFTFHTPRWAQVLGGKLSPPTQKPKLIHYFNPLYWVIWSAKFFFSWLISRPYASLGPAIPAILVAIALGVLVYRQRVQGPGWRSSLYRGMLSQAYAEKDYKTAAVSVSTLIDLFPDNLDYRYQRALIEVDLGHEELAAEMMARLAVGKQHGLAAMWLISKQYDLKTLTDWKPEEHGRFRALMAVALKDLKGRNLNSAKTIMASYLAGIGAVREAIGYLAEAAESNRDLSLMAAALSQQIGDTAKSKSFADAARRHYETQLSASPNDIDLRLNLARSLLLLELEQEAVNRLADGLQLTQDERLKQAVGEALISWSNRIGKNDTTSSALIQRLQLVCRAAQYAPNNPLVIESIVSLALECSDDKNAEIAKLREAAMAGVDPGSVHFIRGTVALLNDRFEEAKMHLDLAAKSGEQLPGILNNLAVAIAGKEDGSLEQALQLSEAAIKQLPNHPYLRETRGQILVKMKRYSDAIPELERGMTSPELRPAIYPSLAIAYRELGDEAMADEYDKMSKKE